MGNARVAELVDALDLGSSGVTCRGSSPLSRTTIIEDARNMVRNGSELGMCLEIKKIIIRFSAHGRGFSRLNVDTDKPGAHNLR